MSELLTQLRLHHLEQGLAQEGAQEIFAEGGRRTFPLGSVVSLVRPGAGLWRKGGQSPVAEGRGG